MTKFAYLKSAQFIDLKLPRRGLVSRVIHVLIIISGFYDVYGLTVAVMAGRESV